MKINRLEIYLSAHQAAQESITMVDPALTAAKMKSFASAGVADVDWGDWSNQFDDRRAAMLFLASQKTNAALAAAKKPTV